MATIRYWPIKGRTVRPSPSWTGIGIRSIIPEFHFINCSDNALMLCPLGPPVIFGSRITANDWPFIWPTAWYTFRGRRFGSGLGVMGSNEHETAARGFARVLFRSVAAGLRPFYLGLRGDKAFVSYHFHFSPPTLLFLDYARNTRWRQFLRFLLKLFANKSCERNLVENYPQRRGTFGNDFNKLSSL